MNKKELLNNCYSTIENKYNCKIINKNFNIKLNGESILYKLIHEKTKNKIDYVKVSLICPLIIKDGFLVIADKESNKWFILDD